MLDQHETSIYDVSTKGMSLLKYASIKGQADICSLLLSRNADPCFRDQTGTMAMQPGIDRLLSGSRLDRNPSGTPTTTSELFNRSEYLEMQCFTLLHLAVLQDALQNQSLCLVMVLKYAPGNIDEPDINGRTPLLWAAWRGDLDQVNLLLEYGAAIDQADSQSWTPLAKACKAGHLNVVHRLIQAKASLDIATSQGYQPIHHASDDAVTGTDIVKILIDAGADPNAFSHSRATPLHNGANRGSTETIEYLLRQGSHIDAVDGDGDTPAMTALLCWNEAAFTCLVQKGAQLDIARGPGHTIVHAAVWGSHPRIWQLLLEQARRGNLVNVEVNAQHNGHGVSTCFRTCRDLWYVDSRDVGAELVLFEEMIQAVRRLP